MWVNRIFERDMKERLRTCGSDMVYQRKYESPIIAEHKHVQDIKEEAVDYAVCDLPEGRGGGSHATSEAGKRTSAEMGPETDLSSSSKRAKVSAEVS